MGRKCGPVTGLQGDHAEYCRHDMPVAMPGGSVARYRIVNLEQLQGNQRSNFISFVEDGPGLHRVELKFKHYKRQTYYLLLKS